MRYLLLFTFLICTAASFAQFYQPHRWNIDNFIVFRERFDRRFVKISTESKVSIVTKEGNHYKGKVSKIKRDTIYLNDTIIMTSQLDSVFLAHPPFPMKPLIYVSSSSDYEMYIPPQDIYNNFGKRQRYMQQIAGTTRKTHHVYADSAQNPLLLHNYIKWNLMKLLHLELAFSYEVKIAPRLTWETEISGILGIPNASFSLINYHPYYNYDGFSVTTYPKFFIIGTRSYLSPVFMYRYLQFYKVRTSWPEHNEDGSLEDQFRNDFGLSLRIGHQNRFRNMVVDIFLGAGIKVINLHELLYAYYNYSSSVPIHYINPDHSPVIYDKVLWGPVINAGIKLGLGW